MGKLIYGASAPPGGGFCATCTFLPLDVILIAAKPTSMLNLLILLIVIVGIIFFVQKSKTRKKRSSKDLGFKVIDKIREDISNRSYREVITISPSWPEILENILDMKFDDIFSRFESVGLKFNHFEEILAPQWRGINWGSISFETYYDVKSGLKINTCRLYNQTTKTFQIHNTPEVKGHVFSEKIHEMLIRPTGDTESKDFEIKLKRLSEEGLDMEKLETVVIFGNDGSISLEKPNEHDGRYRDFIGTLTELPIRELRTIGRLNVWNDKFSNINLSRYFNVLNDWHEDEKDFHAQSPYQVRPLDVLKKSLSELNLELKTQEDEWGVYGDKVDTFHSKFGYITYAIEAFEQENGSELYENLRKVAILIGDYNKEKYHLTQ
jgi:hypothetical protein